MSRSRRLYLYTVALFGLVVSLVSLVMFLWRIGANQVGGLLGAEPPSGVGATPALPWLVLFVIATATWLFHIINANRQARPLTMTGAAERAAPERKMYLYGGRLIVIGILAAQVWLLVRAVAMAVLDGGTTGLLAAAGWPAGLGLGAAAAFGYWVYLHREALADGDLGQERGGAVLWRRLYTYGAALAGAVLAFVGGAELIRALIRVLMTPLSGDTAWHSAAAGALAALVVGLPLASFAWRAANRAAAFNPPVETNALSRVLLRHGGVLVATLVTLVTFGYLIEQVILRAIGRPDGVAGRPLLGMFDWTWALAYLPVAAVTWISFAGGARMDASWGGEKPRTAAIRRVVRYLLTGAALLAFWYGLTEFTRLILQVFLGADTTSATAAQWVQRFATSAAFLLVGAPAWWGHWWSQQIRARGDDAQAHSERASKVRRVYLAAIVLIGAAVVVAAAGFALFLAINWQSAAATGGIRAALAGALAAAIVALFWALMHGLILRGDVRWLAARQPATQSGGEPVEVWTTAPALDSRRGRRERWPGARRRCRRCSGPKRPGRTASALQSDRRKPRRPARTPVQPARAGPARRRCGPVDRGCGGIRPRRDAAAAALRPRGDRYGGRRGRRGAGSSATRGVSRCGRLDDRSDDGGGGGHAGGVGGWRGAGPARCARPGRRNPCAVRRPVLGVARRRGRCGSCGCARNEPGPFDSAAAAQPALPVGRRSHMAASALDRERGD